MTQEELNQIVEKDPYLVARKNPSDAELRLFLHEVNFHCPLCGKELQSRRQKKQAQKLFQIAHIYPNRPTIEQYLVLGGAERLGNNSESYENKIALCQTCHSTQDFHTTLKEYILLLEIKKKCLLDNSLHDITISLGLEDQIADIVQKLNGLSDCDLAELNYEPVPISKKFTSSETLLRAKISGYINMYYPIIRDELKNLDGKNGFLLHILSEQIRSCFLKMNTVSDDKTMIFNHIVEFIKERTHPSSHEACEAVVAYFVQNCEVFYETTQ